MRLSTKPRYGLRILHQIATVYGQGTSIKGKVIAKTQDISEAYLEQIMIPLKNAGLVRTIRGCNGGYILNVKPADVSVLNVIELFEGKLEFVECTSKSSPCPRAGFCPTTGVWKRLTNVVRREASGLTLETIINGDVIDESVGEYII